MVGWFICPYKRLVGARKPTRYCAIDDFRNEIINTDGGQYVYLEVLGNQAIVKVNASSNTLSLIAASYLQLPTKLLSDSLSDLSSPVKQTIKNQLTNAGYSLTEIQNVLGSDIGQKTFKNLLQFLATRRLTPRYDATNDVIVLDGVGVSCGDVSVIDQGVQ